MSENHPELIFVSGPQDGQRVVLSHPVAVLGREGGADIMLSEGFVSRLQARYELVRAGPVLENLSKRGTWINGKRYKAGKQILLETGDVIGVGQETQILFISAGDDPEAALAEYRKSVEAGAGRDAFGSRVQVGKQDVEPAAAAPEPSEPEEEEPFDEDSEQVEQKTIRPSEMTVAQRVKAESKARRRKVVIGLSIYLGVIVIGAIILKSVVGKQESKLRPMPKMMKSDEIVEAVRAPVSVPSINKSHMKERLDKALALYRQYGLELSHLYQCVFAFKEALAYSGKGYFKDPEHDEIYREVLDKLTEEIKDRYIHAYLQEQHQKWHKAEREFYRILEIFGDKESPLFKNVRDHYERVKHIRLQKEKRKKRRNLWGR